MDQVKRLDRLYIGKSLLVETVHLGIHSGTFLIIVPHYAKKRAGHQCAERNSKKCKQCKCRVVIQNDSKCTDEPESINDQVGNPVQDTAGNI